MRILVLTLNRHRQENFAAMHRRRMMCYIVGLV
jgi:hypothetical protein